MSTILSGIQPTGNLHSSQGEIIMDLLSELHRDGMTIIQVTHSEKNANYGSRIIEILDGRIHVEKYTSRDAEVI